MRAPKLSPPPNLGRGSLTTSGVLSLEDTETPVTGPVGPVPAGDLTREGAKIKGLYDRITNNYLQYQASDDARNLDYYAGKQWSAPVVAFPQQPSQERYSAMQNEVFPVVDAMTAALAMEMPQVSFEDQRVTAIATPDRATDGALAGRRIAAVYNNWAQLDDLDETVAGAVRNALIFDKGGIVKTAWDTKLGRPIWRVLGVDEVFFDPLARDHRSVGWACELFTLHWDDFKDLCTPNGDQPAMYQLTPELARAVRPEIAPVQLRDKLTEEPQDQADRQLVREYVPMVEWHDCRKGVCYHLHRETGAILMTFDTPLGNPYRRLVPNPMPGKSDGISTVSLIAPNQRTINELVAGREQVVRRMVQRLIVDASLFADDKEREDFKNSKSWEPLFVKNAAADRPLERYFHVTPPMPLGMDFNAHLAQTVEALRYTAGAAAYMQGKSENIRTAEEATMIRGATQGRLQVMSAKVIKFVSQLFDDARAYMKWALANPGYSNINVQDIWIATQTDTPIEEFERELAADTRMFTLAAFNPLMKDETTRRATLSQVLPTILGSPLLGAYQIWELARELNELYGIRLSTLLPADVYKKLQEQAAQAQQAPPEGAAPPEGQAPPEEAPPAEDEGGIPPEILAALTGGGAAPA